MKDEIYFIVRGTTQFYVGHGIVEAEENIIIFVPAETVHRFTKLSKGFAVWVIFYGPIGGEFQIYQTHIADKCFILLSTSANADFLFFCQMNR